MSALRFGTRLAAAVSVSLLAVQIGQAEAQQPPVTPQAAPTQGAAPQAPAKPKAKPAQAPTDAAASSGGGAAAAGATPAAGGDGALKKRVEQLEEQLVDMQVVIGTLESLARAGVRPPAAAPAVSGGSLSGSDQSRLETLETQIRALSAQVEQLSQGRRSDVRPSSTSTATGSVAANAAGSSDQTAKIGQWSSSAGTASAPLPPDGDAPVQADGARFGAGPVTAGSLDPIGPQDSASTGAGAGIGAAPGGGGALGSQMAAADPVSQNPKQLYEQAYGYLLQQNYPSAQAGFKDFLKSYPKDGLAPNALYWLGETHYVQRNYGEAAEAFDLVTSAYSSSIKAPDAQLKRGMSLAQLGKKQEACTALRDLATKFPAAPVHIKQKADTERQRNACP